MKEQDRNSRLIGYILNLLNIIKFHHIEIDQLLSNDDLLQLFPASDSQNIQMACEILTFMDEIPGGFLIYYASGKQEIIYANQGLLRIFQCATMKEFREWTKNSFTGIVHPDDLEAVENSIQQQIASDQNKLDYVEYRIIRKDGEVRWIEDYGHFIHIESVGDIFYVFLGDATEKRNRQQTEKATLLKEKMRKEQSLQKLVKKYDQEKARRLEVIEGLSINYESILYANLDQDTILPYRLSSRVARQFGAKLQMRPFAWYVSDYVNTWVHPEDRKMVAEATSPEYIREKLSQNMTYYINYRVIENSETLYLQLRIVNTSHNKHISQIVMGYRKIDEELQHEIEQKQILAEALNSANQASNAKNTFLSNMSHDMRTPLNAIFGFTSLAKKNLTNADAVQSYLDRIETSSRQLLDLINKVLEFSGTSSGEPCAEEEEFDLCGAMQEVYQFLLPQAQEKSLSFTLDCSGVEHTHIYSNQDKLKQLIMYLSNNAVTYTQSGGKVSLIVREQERLPNDYSIYQFIVEDTGIGIGQEFLKRIFEPFARERNTTLSGIHGIGLGLTIAKNIVDMMSGTIDAKSRVGAGSTFTVTLRFRTPDQSLPPPASEDDSLSQSSCKKILLVEDNEINQEIETEILQDLGFIVETAEDGSIAVEKMERAAPGAYDLILMDIQMPVMDGWQATRAIRKIENPAISCIPIIALSANVLERDMRMSIESGMDAHLPKPLDIPLLLKTVEEIVRKRQSFKNLHS